MKKVMLFALTLLLGWSCQKDQEQLTPVDPVPEAELSFVVPVDEALQRLEVALDRIDGEVTRAGNRRMVKSIERVKAARALRGGTRTMGDQPALEDLFYIVSFGEGQGSAVLGADRRLESIYAILDETVLTAEDFNPPASTRSTLPTDDDSIRFVASEEELTDFITGMIVNAASIQDPDISSLDQALIEVPKQPLPFTRTENRIVDSFIQSPRLKTKWGQGAPYNNLCPYVNTAKTIRGVAGCVPVAIAQFLYNMRWPASGNIEGESFNWDLLENMEYGEVQTPESRNEVARLMAHIGNIIGATYNYDEKTGYRSTSATLLSLRTMLNEMYINAIKSTFNSANISQLRSLILNQGPACMRGENANDVGHAWIVDGWNEYTLEQWRVSFRVNIFGEEIIVSEEYLGYQTYKMMHCNFGWEGTCDGYYSFSSIGFNAAATLPDEQIDSSIGDAPVPDYWDETTYNFIKNFYFINY